MRGMPARMVTWNCVLALAAALTAAAGCGDARRDATPATGATDSTASVPPVPPSCGPRAVDCQRKTSATATSVVVSSCHASDRGCNATAGSPSGMEMLEAARQRRLGASA